MQYLNDSYNIYFHCPYSTDWTNKSYSHIANISTVEDYCYFNKAIEAKLSYAMFFVMKTDCFPTWDDESNKEGGVLCIKVLKADLHKYWDELCTVTLGETLLKEKYRDDFDEINGLSFSPKKSFAICKIWLRSEKLNDPSFFNIPSGYYGDVIYKSNQENIQYSHK
jgi:hypothetical protein